MNVGNFNKTLTNDIVSFEQRGPDALQGLHCLMKRTNESIKIFEDQGVCTK